MCVIVYKPKESTIVKRTLKDCWNTNPHSGGFMFAVKGKLIIKKGYMTFKKFYRDFRACEKQNYVDFILHFRIATHGRIDKENCHPFKINENAAFAHNGILNCVKKHKTKSDTALFCEDVLQKLPKDFLDRPEYHTLLESVCENESSKFAFMTNEGVVHLINELEGVWEWGCWFSNDHFMDIYIPMAAKAKWQGHISEYASGLEGEYVECVWCGDYVPAEDALDHCCKTCASELEQDKIPYEQYLNY